MAASLTQMVFFAMLLLIFTLAKTVVTQKHIRGFILFQVTKTFCCLFYSITIKYSFLAVTVQLQEPFHLEGGTAHKGLQTGD